MKINRGLKVDGDLKDRGKIKWTAMMLPEHVAELRQWQEDYDKVKKPVLDAFDYDTMQEEIERALISEMETRLTSWKNGKLHYHRGIIKHARGRYIQRMTPITSIRKTLSVDLEAFAEEILKPYFHSGGPTKKVCSNRFTQTAK